MVVRRVLACSRSRRCCRRCSRITGRDARSRPRTITLPPRHGTCARNATISFGSLLSARGVSWLSGSSLKSECIVGVPRLFRDAPAPFFSDSALTETRSFVHFIDRLIIPFVYQPRTRPQQPILSSPFPFLSTVKSLPEEWFQVTTTIRPKAISDIEPIDCHVNLKTLICRTVPDLLAGFLVVHSRRSNVCSVRYDSVPPATHCAIQVAADVLVSHDSDAHQAQALKEYRGREHRSADGARVSATSGHDRPQRSPTDA